MTKLLTQYAAQPTQANLEKIAKHIAKRPMALAMATKDDLAMLRTINLI